MSQKISDSPSKVISSFITYMMGFQYKFLMIFRSTKNFQKKYGLTLTAATFVIIDYSEASMEIACEWQKCIGDTINLVSPLKCGS